MQVVVRIFDRRLEVYTQQCEIKAARFTLCLIIPFAIPTNISQP